MINILLFALFADVAIDAAPIYKANCGLCHAADGSGQTPTGKAMKVRDLRSPEVQKMSDQELAAVIANGKQKMPAYKAKLAAADIDALVAYIRKFKK